MLKQDLIDGFRKFFNNPDRQPMIEISYEKDVVPFFSEPRKLMYMCHSGVSIPDAISKFKWPKGIDRLLIDVSCNTTGLDDFPIMV